MTSEEPAGRIARFLLPATPAGLELDLGGGSAPPDVTRLPVPDGSVARVTLDEAAMPALGVTSASFERLASELERAVCAGGVVVLSLSNPWVRRLGVDRLRHALAGSSVPRSREGLRPTRAPSWNVVVRSMARHGFSRPETYVPLPDALRPKIIVPADDPVIVRYCLDNLIRKNSPLMRGALAGVKLLAWFGRFGWAAPHVFVCFRRLHF